MWLVFDVDGPTWKWLALSVLEVATTALVDEHAAELLGLRLAGDGGEPIA
jgi:hypothetical protein